MAWLRTRTSVLKWRARPRFLTWSRYFFFLGFLTSFLGLLSFATRLILPYSWHYNRNALKGRGEEAVYFISTRIISLAREPMLAPRCLETAPSRHKASPGEPF